MKTLKYLILLLVLVSCATSKFVQTGKIHPPYSGIVKVFRNEVPKNIKFEEIGIVSSSGGQIHEWAHLIEALQKEAAEYGANAILIGEPEKTKSSSFVSNQFGTYASSGSQKSMTAVAIRTYD